MPLEQINTSIVFKAQFIHSTTGLPFAPSITPVVDVYKYVVASGNHSKIKDGVAATATADSDNKLWFYQLLAADVGSVPADFAAVFRIPGTEPAVEKAILKEFSVGRAGIGVLAQPLLQLPAVAPSATPTLDQLLMLLYMSLRNKTETSSSAYKIFDGAGTAVVLQSTMSDDGTKFTRGIIGAGA